MRRVCVVSQPLLPTPNFASALPLHLEKESKQTHLDFWVGQQEQNFKAYLEDFTAAFRKGKMRTGGNKAKCGSTSLPPVAAYVMRHRNTQPVP